MKEYPAVARKRLAGLKPLAAELFEEGYARGFNLVPPIKLFARHAPAIPAARINSEKPAAKITATTIKAIKITTIEIKMLNGSHFIFIVPTFHHLEFAGGGRFEPTDFPTQDLISRQLEGSGSPDAGRRERQATARR